jgi:hypothetical protein
MLENYTVLKDNTKINFVPHDYQKIHSYGSQYGKSSGCSQFHDHRTNMTAYNYIHRLLYG